jgi:hypothetical protein
MQWEANGVDVGALDEIKNAVKKDEPIEEETCRLEIETT